MSKHETGGNNRILFSSLPSAPGVALGGGCTGCNVSLSVAQEGLGGKVKEEEEKEGLTVNDSPIIDACICILCVIVFSASELQNAAIYTPGVCSDQSVQRDSPQILARSHWPHCLLIRAKEV